MDLKNYFAILQRWGWIILLCTALAAVTSYWYSAQLPKVYQSRARYLIGPALDNPNVNSNDLRASSQIGQTYAEITQSRPILQGVIDKLKLDTDPDTLDRQINATWIDTTQILAIRVQALDPVAAANIANALGDALIERSPNGSFSVQAARRQAAESQLAQLQETIRATQAEIDQIANQVQQTTDATGQRALIVRMDERRSQLAATQRAYSDLFQQLQTSNVNQITLVEPAVPDPENPVAPDIQRNVLAAVIAGLVLGLAATMLLEYFTDVIYTPEVLRKATGLTFLGGLPRYKKLRNAKGRQLVALASPDTLAAESYRILRTNLQIAGTDRHLPSLLITSPSRGDGKSDVAANLAVTLARAGKRVILIDANLRRPQIAAIFGVADQDGLADLLNQSDRLPAPVPVPAVPGLSILPAGGAAQNSSEILGSQRMYRLIQEFKTLADVVLIDSPPLWYSDALALAPQVDGVLLVVSRGTTGRENTINAVESLRLVGARLIGTVLNRVKAGPAYFYYPTYAPGRLALTGPGINNASPHALSASTTPAAPAAPRAQLSVADAPPSEPRAPAPGPSAASDPDVSDVAAYIGGAALDVDGAKGGAADQGSSQPDMKTTTVLDVVNAEPVGQAAASEAFALPSEDLAELDASARGAGSADDTNGTSGPAESDALGEGAPRVYANGHLSAPQGGDSQLRPGRKSHR